MDQFSEILIFVLAAIATAIISVLVKRGCDALFDKKQNRSNTNKGTGQQNSSNVKNSGNTVASGRDTVIGDGNTIDNSTHNQYTQTITYNNYYSRSRSASSQNDDAFAFGLIFLVIAGFTIAGYGLLNHYGYFNLIYYLSLGILVILCMLLISLRYPKLTLSNKSTKYYILLIVTLCSSGAFALTNILLSDSAISLENLIISTTSSFDNLDNITSNFWSFDMLEIGFKICLLLIPIFCLTLECYSLLFKKRTALLSGKSPLRIYFSFILFILIIMFAPSLLALLI